MSKSVKSYVLLSLLGFFAGVIISFITYTTIKAREDLIEGSFCSKSLNLSVADQLKEQSKILCWVMTYPENHHSKAIHIKNTWGKRSDILLFMTTKDDSSLPTVRLSVREGRLHLWEKTREAFKYLYKYYLMDVDWFLKADDDTYVILENLRLFLHKLDSSKPYFLGSLLRQKPDLKFMYGGSGYVLSKETLRRYVEVSLSDPTSCFNPDTSKNEDMYLGKCLENVGVQMLYTHDLFGKERFLHNNLPTVFDEWGGMECCSDYAITMHYITPKQMYVMDYFLYDFMLQGVIYVPEVLEYRGTLPYTPLSFLSWLMRDQDALSPPKMKLRADHVLMENEDRTMADEIASRISILCLILVPGDGDGNHRTLHIRETWGKRCNILLFLGPIPDDGVPILELANAGKTKWRRLTSGMQYVYDYYLNHVDWIFCSGITTYAVLENIRHALYNYKGNESPMIFTQRDQKENDGSPMNIGFIISNEALRRFVEESLPDPKKCASTNRNDDIISHLITCLNNVGVIRKETVDSDDKQTLLPINFDVPRSHALKHRVDRGKEGKITCHKGVDCFSNTPLAFGEISIEDMYVLEYLIYHLRPFGVDYNPEYNFSYV